MAALPQSQRKPIALAALLLVLLSCSLLDQEEERFAFRATLSGDQVVPPTNSSATGVISIDYLPQFESAAITGPTSGLSSPVTGAYLGHGPPGEQGKIFTEVTGGYSNELGKIEYSFSLSTPAFEALQAGEVYILLTTEAYPAGEIRGQFSGE